ncbi:hypothetical protein T492DRAFT_883028 [Pavlovales sp. CCMP2436]|nr:hypothetical protein T492DRAFT_883028 [Pavlovales sp. CCMP2436]
MEVGAPGKRPAETFDDTDDDTHPSARAKTRCARSFLVRENEESAEQLAKAPKGELVAACAARGLPTTGLKPALAAHLAESAVWLRVEVEESVEMYDNSHLFTLGKLPSASEAEIQAHLARLFGEDEDGEKEGEEEERSWGGPAFCDSGYPGDRLGYGCGGSIHTPLADAGLHTGDRLQVSTGPKC